MSAISDTDCVNSIRDCLAEIKDQLHEIDSKLDVVFVSGTPRSNEYRAMLRKEIDDHESRIKAIESLVPFIKASMTLAGLLSVSVIGLIWAIIIGQVVLVTP